MLCCFQVLFHRFRRFHEYRTQLKQTNHSDPNTIMNSQAVRVLFAPGTLLSPTQLFALQLAVKLKFRSATAKRRYTVWQSKKHFCLWKKSQVVLELKWFCQQRDLCFIPPRHGCHPLLAINQVRTKVNPPPGICHLPMNCATPPPLTCHPPCGAAITTEKNLGLWGQISGFSFENKYTTLLSTWQVLFLNPSSKTICYGATYHAVAFRLWVGVRPMISGFLPRFTVNEILQNKHLSQITEQISLSF